MFDEKIQLVLLLPLCLKRLMCLREWIKLKSEPNEVILVHLICINEGNAF